MSRIRFIIALAFLIVFWGYPASEVLCTGGPDARYIPEHIGRCGATAQPTEAKAER